MITEPERVKLTISCDDCSYIPKVHNAGLVSDEKYQIHIDEQADRLADQASEQQYLEQ